MRTGWGCVKTQTAEESAADYSVQLVDSLGGARAAARPRTLRPQWQLRCVRIHLTKKTVADEAPANRTGRPGSAEAVAIPKSLRQAQPSLEF